MGFGYQYISQGALQWRIGIKINSARVERGESCIRYRQNLVCKVGVFLYKGRLNRVKKAPVGLRSGDSEKAGATAHEVIVDSPKFRVGLIHYEKIV